MKILLKDRRLISSRPLTSTIFEESGDVIEGSQQSQETFKKTFAITLKRTILHEEDTNTNCTVYPNEKFSTYKDCDDAFIQKSYEDIRRDQVDIYYQSELQLLQGRYNLSGLENLLMVGSGMLRLKGIFRFCLSPNLSLDSCFDLSRMLES